MTDNYAFWTIHGNTCEGNRAWFTARTPDYWEEYQVGQRASRYLYQAIGGDICEITEIEPGMETDNFQEYLNESEE